MLTAALSIIAFAVIILIIMQVTNPHPYSKEIDRVVFVSAKPNPLAQLEFLAERRLFIVSPELYPEGTANTYMTGPLVQFLTIFESKKRSTITIARAINPQTGELMYCQTNKGDERTNEELAPEDCKLQLSNPDYVKVYLSFPKANAAQSKVILEQNQITIQPASYNTMTSASITVLKQMYEDTEDIIDSVNVMIGNL